MTFAKLLGDPRASTRVPDRRCERKLHVTRSVPDKPRRRQKDDAAPGIMAWIEGRRNRVVQT
ncbi:MAG: hypothetical protein ACREPT_09810, partial [Rudaea sp.]